MNQLARQTQEKLHMRLEIVPDKKRTMVPSFSKSFKNLKISPALRREFYFSSYPKFMKCSSRSKFSYTDTHMHRHTYAQICTERERHPQTHISKDTQR